VTYDDDAGATITSDVTTRLVEADLGRRYRAGHDVEASSRRGPVDVLTPHRVRVLYRRPAGARRGWVVTQVIVIGRGALALARWRYDGGPPPPERQRTYADLGTAPLWVGELAYALVAADRRREEDGP
jgi:hypothetical protein